MAHEAINKIEGEVDEKLSELPTDSQQSMPKTSSSEEKGDVVIETGSEDVKKAAGDEEKSGSMGDYIRLWSYAQPIDTLMRIVGFLAAIGAGSALPLMTVVLGDLINIFNDWERRDEFGNRSISSQAFMKGIEKNTLWFVYLFIGKFVFVYLHTTCFTISATRMTRSIRLAYIKAILRQEIAYFDTCTPGSVATRISTNADLIQTGLSEKVGVATQGLAMLISAFVVAFSQQWKLTLVTATTLPAVIILVGTSVAFDQKLEVKILDLQTKAGGFAEEALGSIKNVVAFGAHEKLKKKYDSFQQGTKTLGKKKGPLMGLQYSAEFSVMYCAYALAFWYGIRLLLKGEISDGGKVVTVFFACIIATTSLTIIAPSIGCIVKAAAAAKDVLEMIAREPVIDSTSTDGLKPESLTGQIELRNVTFKYPARPTIQVLDGINIVFEEGKTTALVGSSGSGKSTIVGLVERWYDTESGEITLDGHNLKDLNIKWLRSQMGMVQQEPVLFNDTIFENVAHGLQGSELATSLSEAEKRKLVEEACIQANAHSFIENLPEGYDTVVGERATLLSGGQKQRIAIARSIISNPRILLLDEATSALDPKAEKIVQTALENVAKSRTTIMIAHRLSTVKNADKIVVLSKGSVIEQGTHQELLAAEGAYYRLVVAQNLALGAGGDEDEEEEEESEAEVDSSPKENTRDGGDIERIETRRSAFSVKTAPNEPSDSLHYGLLRCLWIIFYEHRRLWAWFLAGVIGCIMGGAVFPAQAIMFSRLVTVFALPPAQLEDRGNFWALMFLFLALGTLVAYGTIGMSWTSAAFSMGRVYRSQYFEAMITQDIAFFDLPENSSAALTARLSSDAQAVHDLIQNNLGLLIIVGINLTSCSILSLVLGWRLALVALFGCLPFLFGAGFIRIRLELSSQERVSKFFLESTRFASEAVGAIRTVSSLTLEGEVLNRYAMRLNTPVRSAYTRTLWVMIMFGLSESVDLLGVGLAFWYGGKLVSQEVYSTQTFFVVFIAVVFGGQAAGFFFGFTSNLTKAHHGANEILKLRGSKPKINSSTGDDLPQPPEGGDLPVIEFKDVRFTYPSRPEVSVLRHCNFKIKKGERIGVVGASGCGKTTVISLLERFYDITSGEILINGASLRSLDVHRYRRIVSLVSQEPTLYQGSIRDNITLGTPDSEIPDSKVVQAAKDANIHDFIISLPEGYNTDVGSKGVALSGGQRQRMAIARALIRDPEVLLLDEATSALDTESEKVVQEAIEKASKGRTTVAVAHRLSTVRTADRIMVFDNGNVVESGTHEELIDCKGRYWAMCQGQSLDRDAVELV